MAADDAPFSADAPLGERYRYWLQREAAGTLKSEEQVAIDTLRGRGAFPPPLQRESTGRPDVARYLERYPALGAVGQLVKHSVLPMVGELGLGIPATMAGGPMAGIPAGMLGAAGGEAANQLFGITEPSGGQVALAGAAPLIGAALKPAGQTAVAHLPGAPGYLQERSVGRLRALGSEYLPAPGTSTPMYEAVRAVGDFPVTTTANLDQAVTAAIARIGQLEPEVRPGALDSVLAGYRRLANRDPTFNDYWENMKRIGELKREAADAGKPRETGMYSQLVKAMRRDLETMPSDPRGPSVDLLKAANVVKAREYAREELEASVRKNISTVGEYGLEQGNYNKVLNFVRNDEAGAELRKALRPDEFADLVDTLKVLARTPKIPPPAATNVGTGRRIANYALLGGGGALLAGPEGAAAGSIAAGALSKWGAPLIARALMTDRGRAAIRFMVGHGISLDAKVMPALAVLGAEGFAAAPTEVGPAAQEAAR